jgi:hypothetical protein
MDRNPHQELRSLPLSTYKPYVEADKQSIIQYRIIIFCLLVPYSKSMDHRLSVFFGATSLYGTKKKAPPPFGNGAPTIHSIVLATHRVSE